LEVYKSVIILGYRKRGDPFQIDGQNHKFETKDPNITANDMKNAFIDILTILDKIENEDKDDFRAETYQEERKNFSTAFKLFFKNFKNHVKKKAGHDITVGML